MLGITQSDCPTLPEKSNDRSALGIAAQGSSSFQRSLVMTPGGRVVAASYNLSVELNFRRRIYSEVYLLAKPFQNIESNVQCANLCLHKSRRSSYDPI
jgi:hypothetical protein